jgi:2-oxoglutarate/2-oxoacid ferredoxin oxidoreductase subunit alpha
MPIDFNYMVGGEAGQGVQSVASLLGKIFNLGGYHVFADQDYESRIRGGHNFFRVRVKDVPVHAVNDRVDALIALNDETIRLHESELTERGIIIFDNDKVPQITPGKSKLGIPLEKLAIDHGNRIMVNTVALGAALALVNYDFSLIETILKRYFKDDETSRQNIDAARAGYDYTRSVYKGNFPELKPLSSEKRLMLTGAEAVALGALAAGCKFMAAYPMTPATSIMEYFAKNANEYGLVMVHAEDEIAAIHMAIGASYAGTRSMTATSGGGFCLMVEGLGLAGMTETPLVVIEGQRAGPAIGLPTRTEQGDLLFILHAHHGDFPRAVLAPATIEDCFWDTVRAFNLAERYQIPVIVVIDTFLAGSFSTVNSFDLSKVTIDRGRLYSPRGNESPVYLRHAITMDGISPRAFPGLSSALVVTDSDEHDEAGHLSEDAAIRKAQMDKRLRKAFSLRQEITEPVWYGPRKSDHLLIGWGSTYGALREAVDMVRHETEVSLLHLTELCPFPAEVVADAISKAKTCHVVENNATGQLSRLIRMETGKDITGKILKYDGRPFTPAYIAEIVRKECEC